MKYMKLLSHLYRPKSYVTLCEKKKKTMRQIEIRERAKRTNCNIFAMSTPDYSQCNRVSKNLPHVSPSLR